MTYLEQALNVSFLTPRDDVKPLTYAECDDVAQAIKTIARVLRLHEDEILEKLAGYLYQSDFETIRSDWQTDYL